MNERIKELAEQAKLISSEPNGFDQNNLSKAQQKFAELIIQECIKINRQELSFVAFDVLHNRYEGHFGTNPDWKPYEFQEL